MTDQSSRGDAIIAVVREIVSSQYDGKAAMNDDTPLEEYGFDSIRSVVLVSMIEESFGHEFDFEDLTPENFKSIATIVDLVSRYEARQE